MPFWSRAAYLFCALSCAACTSRSSTSADDEPEPIEDDADDDPTDDDEPADDDPSPTGGRGGSGGVGGNAGGTGGEAMPDAAAADAATAAGGRDAAAPSDGPPVPVPGVCTSLFCEDFEAAATIAPSWTVRTGGGNTVTLDEMMPAHGQRAIKFHANPNTELAMIFGKIAAPELRQHLWGRAYFRVTPEPPDGHTAFVTAGTMEGYPYSDDHFEISGYHNTWQLGFWGQGEIISAGGMIPLMRWACIEWELSNTLGIMTVYVDGKRSWSHGGIGRNKIASGFTDVAFGFRSWHPAPHPVDIWMDDLALDDERIGCFAP